MTSTTSTAACQSSAPGWPNGLPRAREGAGATTTLFGIFEQFQCRWPDPNRGVGIESYPQYRDILDKIIATGLAERRQEWRRRLSEWSGQDLVPLAGAFGAALDEMRAASTQSTTSSPPCRSGPRTTGCASPCGAAF